MFPGNGPTMRLAEEEMTFGRERREAVRTEACAASDCREMSIKD
jgi:hypothetical protein